MRGMVSVRVLPRQRPDRYPPAGRRDHVKSVVADIDGQMIARSVATREKALSILRAANRPPLSLAFAPFLSIFLVSFGLAGLKLPLLPRIVIYAACMLSFWSTAFAIYLYRQLRALSDLTLLAQER